MLLPIIIDIAKDLFTDGVTSTSTATIPTNWGTTLTDGLTAPSTTAATKVDKVVVGGLAVTAGIAVVGGVAYAAGKQDGVEEGYHDGYTRASEEYEKKFASQVRLFEEKETLLKDDIARYRKLCEDLSAECNRLKNLIENDVRYQYLYMKAASDYILLVQLAMSRGY